MKPRFYLIIGAILFVVIIAVAALGKSTSTTAIQQQRGAPTLQFTIHADTVGLSNILVTNEATAASINVTQNMIPFTGNFAKNDVLTFKVTPRQGYSFNAWVVNDGTWESDNPLSMRPSKDFTMKAYFIGSTTINP